MDVDFQNGRMLVGCRRRDREEVWYAPVRHAEPDDDDTIPMLLYTSAYTPDDEAGAPMEGEVRWFDVFVVDDSDSKVKKEREMMRMQTLYQAWSYLSKHDPDEVRIFEEKYDRPTFRRWQAWFDRAKRHKHKELTDHAKKLEKNKKARDKRAAEKLRWANAVREAGFNLAQVEANLSPSDGSDSEDSAVELENQRRTIRKRSAMGPPPVPRGDAGPRSNKRRGGAPKKGPQNKKQKKHSSPEHFMRGALRADDHDESDDDDDDVFPRQSRRSTFGGSSASSIMDNSTPERGFRSRSTGIAGAHQRGTPSAPGPRCATAHDDIDDDEVTQLNGGMSEAEAEARAIRESMPPPETNGAGDED